MIGFFRRHAAVLIAVALASGLAPSISLAQTDSSKSAPPVLVPPADTQPATGCSSGSAATSRGGTTRSHQGNRR